MNLLFAAVLFVGTMLLYLRTSRAEFTNYDDPKYVTENKHVQAGLTPATLGWAWTTFDASNWHPLTWMSHALDCQIFGKSPVGPHLENAALHALAVTLLFWFLSQSTGTLWPSAAAAALFGWHPLRVESVAWIAERKDVLSAVFFFLTLLAYLHYTRRKTVGRYSLILLTFALGLLAKPMIVTLPCLLLLLDYWPLQRPLSRQIILEKLPLLGLAIASSAMTFIAQNKHGAVMALEQFTLSNRVANALVSYLRYLGVFFWPVRLSAFYPLPDNWPPADVLASASLLVVITIVAIWQRHRRPYLLVGWLWFIGMLVPVIGIAQAGLQSIADRYTYLPSVGLCIALMWLAADVWQKAVWARAVITAAAAIAFPLLIATTFYQIGFWHDSQALFRHALAVTDENFIAHTNLAGALLDVGDVDGAEAHYREALRERPQFFYARNGLGMLLLQRGQLAEAKAEFEKSLKTYDDPHVRTKLGDILLSMGRPAEAQQQYSRSLQMDPDQPGAQYNWGNICMRNGQLDEAIAHYRAALIDLPDSAAIHNNLATALAQQGKLAEAEEEFRRAVQADPRNADAQCGLAATLLHAGRWNEAAEHYQAALEVAPGLERAQRGLNLCQMELQATQSGR